MAMEEKNSVLVLGETSAKKAPTFSSGERQDPSKFLDEFNEAASWNNWISTERRKELFFRCLTHYAKEWFLNTFDRSTEAYKKMMFDDGTDESLVAKFKAKFITDEWFDKYEENYENRVQLENESPWEFMNIKRALLRKLDPKEIKERSEKQNVKEIRKGLLPELRKFCEYTEKNPYNNSDKSKTHTYEGLETLLRWAEQCQNNISKGDGNMVIKEVMRLPEPQQVNAILRRPNNNNNVGTQGSRTNDGAQGNSRGYTENFGNGDQLELILKKLQKLDKLDKIENDLALTMDRVELMEKQWGINSSKKLENKKDEGSFEKCFNCNESGHISKKCTEPCRVCNSRDHTSVSCKGRSNKQDFQVNSPQN